MQEKTIRVLLIEDNPMDQLIIQEMLKKSKHYTFQVQTENCLENGVNKIRSDSFDIVLLDLFLPDSQGFETFSQLCDKANDIPIIVLTGLEDETIALQSVNNGAQDYLTKGVVEKNLLIRSICYAIERKKAENKIKYLALYDSLTDLPNRRLFFDRFNQAFARGKRYQHIIALLYIDLDSFKPINDTYGHEVGDQVLIETAKRIKGCLRESDTAARLGGDEFAVVLQDVKQINNAAVVAEKLIHVLTQPIVLENKVCQVGISLGISIYPNDGQDTNTLLNKADAAMYAVKKKGKCAYSFYSDVGTCF